MIDRYSPTSRIMVGDFLLDRGDERLWGATGVIRLGNKAFMVLSRLAQEQGRLVTKDDLFRRSGTAQSFRNPL